MFQALFEFLAGWVADSLVARLWWFILFPVVLLVSLPFILVIALFRKGGYDWTVTDMLSSVYSFWQACG